jgi:molybdopterin-containing oxidoreductase family membrane subunit
MVSGLALLMIAVVAVFKYTKRNLNQELIFSLSRLLRILIIVLAVMVLVDKLTHLYSPHREPTIWRVTGPFSWIFWILQVGCAYLLPLVILFHPRYGKTLKGVILAAFLVVIGIFGERFPSSLELSSYAVLSGQNRRIWERQALPITLAESFYPQDVR